jgi:cytoskeletal protein RodZ
MGCANGKLLANQVLCKSRRRYSYPMRKTNILLTATLSCFLVGGSTASAFFSLFEQNAPPTAPVTPPVTPPATPPVTTDKTTDKANEGTKAPTTKTPAAKTPAKTPAAKTPAAKPPVQEKKKTDAAKEAAETPATDPAPATTPEADIPPEMVKYAKMAKSGKFKEFTRLAAERQALYVKSSALRMELRGAEASQAQ